MWATLTVAVMLTGVVITCAGSWHARHVPDGHLVTAQLPEALCTIVPFGLAGALLIDRRPDLPFGWLLAIGTLLHTVYAASVFIGYTAALAHPPSGLTRWLLIGGTSFGFVQLPIQGLINLRFPGGSVHGRAARWMQRLIVGGTTLAVLGGMFGARSFQGDEAPERLKGMTNPITGGTTVGKIADAMVFLVPVVVLLTLIAGIRIVVRCVQATGLERQQLKWRAAYIVLGFLLFPLAVTENLPFVELDNLVFVLTIVIPVLRFRLWAIDTIVRRSLAYTCVVALLAILYVSIALSAGNVVSSRVGATVAAIAVAVAFAPLRDRAQRLVDRYFYGQRSDPYVALRDFGRRLSATAPGEVFASVVDAVTSTLRLPYVAIERAHDGTVLASSGEPSGMTSRWPLAYEGRVEAYLVASPRKGEDSFDERDRQLLDDVARHAGAPVHAEALTADLLASRQRLVTAREEERRRLRRDLHDGLGPVLTSIGLNLDAAKARLARDPTSAGALLGDAKSGTSQAIADLRVLVHGLRPPALDDLGLLGALRAQTGRLASSAGLRVDLDVDAHAITALPAAVEVAVYRSVIEAVTNAARHARATTCTVRIRIIDARALTVEVIDDGVGGNDTPWTAGVGLTSMRERAEELGGTFGVGPGELHGTRVTITIPVVPVAS